MSSIKREAIVERVLELVELNRNDNSDRPLRFEDELIRDLNMDSLSLFELALDLEESYDLRIEDEEIDNIKTVGEIVSYLIKVLNIVD